MTSGRGTLPRTQLIERVKPIEIDYRSAELFWLQGLGRGGAAAAPRLVDPYLLRLTAGEAGPVS